MQLLLLTVSVDELMVEAHLAGALHGVVVGRYDRAVMLYVVAGVVEVVAVLPY